MVSRIPRDYFASLNGASTPGPDSEMELLRGLARLLNRLLPEAKESPKSAERKPPEEQLVSLNQAAAIVKRKKTTLRHHKGIPEPAVRGCRGQPQLWRWSDLRPWLEREFNRPLPERYPELKRKRTG